MTELNFGNFVEKTKRGEPLTQRELFGFVTKATYDNLPDIHLTAWLMAVTMRKPPLQPLTKEEITNLTLAMAASGDILNLDEFGIVTDKHSSGGVGDKTTLVVAPIVAATGITVAKMSGRGLGHTGGTLDKLESIPTPGGMVPGMRVNLSENQFKKQAEEIGIVVTGQTGTMAPADKKIYAVRDATWTVDSIPLIAASIMSKKIASGSNHLVLDVKVGEGAFMKTLEDARELAKTMVEIGEMVGMTVVAEITNMNQPLGEAVGNALEVFEAINTLKGRGPDDFREHCIETAARMILISGKAENMDEAITIAQRTIDEGTALEKFRQMVKAQGGDERVIDDPKVLMGNVKVTPVYFEGDDGYISNVNPMEIGLAVKKLGGGRELPEDNIDHSVGMIVKAKVGKPIKKGDLLGYIYSSSSQKPEEAINSLIKSVTTSSQPVEIPKVTLETYPPQI
ncbi:thymidine phosphorylase [Candidatus Roizmanbacteria bacterium]|nr:thymidine phosphorylase [Candidatus Roizmanbacteria bacterium]